jgi:hypothetical protein
MFKREMHKQALGRSHVGFGTVVHHKPELAGGALAFRVTGKEPRKGGQSETVFDLGPDVTRRGVINAKVHSANANRDAAGTHSFSSIIRLCSNRRAKPGFSLKRLSRLRGRVEPFIGRIGCRNRIRMGCEKPQP